MKNIYLELLIRPQTQETFIIDKFNKICISSSGRFKCEIYNKTDKLLETGFISFSGLKPFLSKNTKKLVITSMDQHPCYVYISGRKK